MKFLKSAILFASLVASQFALAQSSPNLIYGQVPTAGQWNSYFAAKQDTLGYIPLNTNGGQMFGKLITATPTSVTAGLNLPPGTAPSSPNNGDVWTTSLGVFARVNGSTIALGGNTPVGAATISGNPTNASAARTDFTIQGLASRGAPDPTNDQIVIWDASAGSLKKVTPGAIATASVAGVSSIAANTGAFTLGTGLSNNVNVIQFAAIASNSFWLNNTGSSAIPSAVAFPTCSGSTSALTFNVATHALGCNSLGTVLSVGITGGTGITQSGSPITSSGNITINVDKATASDVWSAAANKVLTSDIVYGGSSGSAVTLSGTSSVTPDFNTGINFQFVATSATNFTLQNPTNQKAGQSGCIYLIQPASGTAVNVSYGTQWYTPGGVTGAVLAPTLGGVSRLCYFVLVPNVVIDFSLSLQALAH